MNTTSTSPLARKQNKILAVIVKYPILPTLACFILMFILFIVLSPRAKDGSIIFLSAVNLTNILEATAGFSIGAFAMTLVLLVGCTDLSTESMIGLSCVIFSLGITVWGFGFWVSALLTLLTGAFCGGINALIALKFKVPPFLSTISVAFVYSGLAYKLSDSRTIRITDPTLIKVFGSLGSGASFLGVPVLVWWTGLLMLGMYLLISKSKFGRWAQATGGNAQAAYSSGVNVKFVRAVAFVLMGLFSAVIGLVFCARLGSASPAYGTGYGLKFIICSILGGTSFTGDGGNVFGSLLGSLLMGVLTNGLGIIGVDAYSQQIVLGVVIVVSVVFSIYISEKK